MKTALQLVTVLFIVATAAHAQVTPEATASTAQLHYSARYAQNSDFLGSSLGDSQDAILSGTLAYTNGVKRLPFALTYGGGYSWNLAGISYDNGLFENVMFSQGIARAQLEYSSQRQRKLSKDSAYYRLLGCPGHRRTSRRTKSAPFVESDNPDVEYPHRQ